VFVVVLRCTKEEVTHRKRGALFYCGNTGRIGLLHHLV
jgi:hypothetical protein